MTILKDNDRDINFCREWKGLCKKYEVEGGAYAVIFIKDENHIKGYGASYPDQTPKKLIKKLKIIIKDMEGIK